MRGAAHAPGFSLPLPDEIPGGSSGAKDGQNMGCL